MLSFLKKIQASFNPLNFNWKDLNLSDLKNYPNGFQEMTTREFDGMFVRNVLTHEETDKIIEGFDSIPDNEKIIMPEGYTYPPVFAQVVKGMSNEKKIENGKKWDVEKDKIDAYFKFCKKNNSEFNNQFNVDFKEKLQNVLSSISGGRPIKSPYGLNKQGQYPFYTIRKLIPEFGDVSIHCGNYFHQEFIETYEVLMEQVNVVNQLSYFIMLDEPEIGGELTLYDWNWKKGQTKKDPGENLIVMENNGSKIAVKDLKSKKFKPKKGDMIIFQGGEIWHRVELVKGLKSRYTIGGFMGISVDNQEIIYWS